MKTTKQIVAKLLDLGVSSIMIVQDSQRYVTISVVTTRGLYEAQVEPLVEASGELRSIQKIGEGDGVEYRYDILFVKF